MDTSTTLIVLCSIALGSLLLVYAINQREAYAKRVSKRLKILRARVSDIEDLVVNLDTLVESRAIPRLVNEELLILLREMQKLSPKAAHIHAAVANAQRRANDLADDSGHQALNRICQSDAQIARTQHALGEAGKALRHQHALGAISTDELQTYINELSWAHLMADVMSHIEQGHKAKRRQELLQAMAFYKKAQHALTHSGHNDTRRHRMIKQLGEILANRRQLISDDLMPDNAFSVGKDFLKPGIFETDPDKNGIGNGNSETATSKRGGRL